MKITFTIIISLFLLISISFSQQIRIHTSSGTDVFSLADIDSITFSMLETGTVTDIDGNVYQTIKIGNQWWMMENLKVTHYRNGEAIPNVTGATEWSDLASDAYCSYDNSYSNGETYGLLYNWHAVNDDRNLAPEGWHVPTDEEWKELEIYLGLSEENAEETGWRGTDHGDKLKETGTVHWTIHNVNATNESGFTALPGGKRNSLTGEFENLTNLACFWTATERNSGDAWLRWLASGQSNMFRSYGFTGLGYSVRCVKDSD